MLSSQLLAFVPPQVLLRRANVATDRISDDRFERGWLGAVLTRTCLLRRSKSAPARQWRERSSRGGATTEGTGRRGCKRQLSATHTGRMCNARVLSDELSAPKRLPRLSSYHQAKHPDVELAAPAGTSVHRDDSLVKLSLEALTFVPPQVQLRRANVATDRISDFCFESSQTWFGVLLACTFGPRCLSATSPPQKHVTVVDVPSEVFERCNCKRPRFVSHSKSRTSVISGLCMSHFARGKSSQQLECHSPATEAGTLRQLSANSQVLVATDGKFGTRTPEGLAHDAQNPAVGAFHTQLVFPTNHVGMLRGLDASMPRGEDLLAWKLGQSSWQDAGARPSVSQCTSSALPAPSILPEPLFVPRPAFIPAPVSAPPVRAATTSALVGSSILKPTGAELPDVMRIARLASFDSSDLMRTARLGLLLNCRAASAEAQDNRFLGVGAPANQLRLLAEDSQSEEFLEDGKEIEKDVLSDLSSSPPRQPKWPSTSRVCEECRPLLGPQRRRWWRYCFCKHRHDWLRRPRLPEPARLHVRRTELRMTRLARVRRWELPKLKKRRFLCVHGQHKDRCWRCRGCIHGRLPDRCSICRPCPHGRVKRACRDCSACPHGRLRESCSICGQCVHGVVRSACLLCSGSACEHGRLRSVCLECSCCAHGRLPGNCPECRGCPHRRLKAWCAECSPCEHGKAKLSCGICSGCPHGLLSRFCCLCRPCEHGRRKEHCSRCQGCEHGKLRAECRLCSSCPHGRVRRFCSQCNPCPHGKRKQSCKECSACPHGRISYSCAECKGCPHGAVKRFCKLCNGCAHGYLRRFCKLCSQMGSTEMAQGG